MKTIYEAIGVSRRAAVKAERRPLLLQTAAISQWTVTSPPPMPAFHCPPKHTHHVILTGFILPVFTFTAFTFTSPTLTCNTVITFTSTYKTFTTFICTMLATSIYTSSSTPPSSPPERQFSSLAPPKPSWTLHQECHKHNYEKMFVHCWVCLMYRNIINICTSTIVSCIKI
jgi:hypothetical protein